MPREFHHVPVLLADVLELLAPAPGRVFVDGTVGGGGHAAALVAHGATVIGFDRDPAALAATRARLPDVELHHATFDEVPRLVPRADGVLLDLGVSSPQLDDPSRGLSFRADGPVDFRMDPTSGAPLAERLDDVGLDELADVLWRYGEERHARRVAQAILAARPLRGTLHLAEVVAGATRGERRIHPATRAFQALRIWVNDELGMLDRALAALPAWLPPGGRLAVISFHSLEDRAVKQRFRALAGVGAPTDPFGHPLVPPRYRLLVPGGRASPDDPNPRARSARLRVLEVLP